MWRGVTAALAGVVVALAAVFACTGSDPDVAGVDGGSGTSSGSASDAAGAAGDGGTTQCPLNCLPLPPEGWKGPSATYDGDPGKLPTCSDQYPREEIKAAYHLPPLEAHTCSCSQPTAPATVSCTFDVVKYGSADCQTASMGSHTLTGECAESPSGGQKFMVFNPHALPFTCAPSELTEKKPEKTYDRGFVACGVAARNECTGRPDCTAAPASLPAGGFSRLCIHRAGEQSCPAQYPDKTVVARDYTDDRTCSPCSATPAATCAASVFTYSTFTAGSCGGSGSQVNVGDCTLNAAGLGMANATAVACKVDGGVATGGIAPVDVTTFCCAR